jgi:hypothetical protein
MTATTAPSIGGFKHRPAPYLGFTVFPWHAHLFLSLSEGKGTSFEFNKINDPIEPHLITFQFTGQIPQIANLIQRYLDAGYPFALSNFDFDEEPATP